MDYEVVLLEDAKRVVRDLELEEKLLLAEGLRTQLTGAIDENVIPVVGRDLPRAHTYLACLLLPGFVPIYRAMTDDELARLRNQGRQRRRRVSNTGFIVFDILIPE